MNYIFQFSKENIDLAKQELISLTNPKDYFLIDNLFMINLKPSEIDFLVKRLAYTKNIFRLLFESNTKDILNDVRNCRWGKIFRESFSLRVKGKRELERRLAKEIWAALKSPKVDLKNATTKIFIFFIEEKAYCCLLAREIYQDYNARKPHKRPELHPSSLNPRLAKAIVNLTGIKKGSIIDPFCGGGGILIEAGLMGLKPVGYDIDQIMINRARINLDHLGIKNYKLIKKNALTISQKINYIVTDVPYGKNTKQKGLYELYSCFLSTLKKRLVKKAVVILPIFNRDNFDYRSMLKKNGLEIVFSFNYYLHKSLTRKIFLIKRIRN